MGKRTNGKAPTKAPGSHPRMSQRGQSAPSAGPSVTVPAASIPDKPSRTIMGSMSRVARFLFSHTINNADDEDADHEEDGEDKHVDGEEGRDGEHGDGEGEGEGEGDDDEEDDEDEDEVQTRRRRAAVDDDFIPDEERARPVRGKLESAIMTELKGIYPQKDRDEIDEQCRGILQAYDKECRMLFLLHFRYEAPNAKENIYSRVIPELARFPRTQKTMRRSIMNRCSSMRRKTLEALKSHVKTAMHDEHYGEKIRECKSMKILVQYFYALHCPANTLEVFHYIENHIDINKSSHAAKSYLRSIYAHFCAFTKLFLDHEDDPHNDDGNKYDKKHLVKYTTTLPMAPDFANLSRADFHELTGKEPTNRHFNKPAQVFDLVQGVDYFMPRAAAAPAPPAPQPPSKRQRLCYGSGSARPRLPGN
ncbi:hypothetical protein VE03_09668 [Pseudogymnoascus sp. 23342-1-I1]|nr:hypothetical protein VE03_09668 [Pseudogymnoascus sp. 23342-1-I1]